MQGSLAHGKNEFDIFKNYYNRRGNIVIHALCNTPLQSKDNVKSVEYRILGNSYFTRKSFHTCLEKYTKSLSYATFNGTAYAMALANRSATYFKIENYKSCIKDVDLSLQADYPAYKKPKLLIRKARCFNLLENYKETLETLDYCVQYIKRYPNLPKRLKDTYKKEIEAVLDESSITFKEFSIEETAAAVEVIKEKNILNPNVSAAIKLEFNKNTGMEYLADRDIKCGEVLIVEEAYTGDFTEFTGDDYSYGFFFCDYCWKEATNCIPCKHCPTDNILYCSENCRDNSWQEYHQWECDIIRSQQIKVPLVFLSLRTVMKGANSGVIYQITDNPKHSAPAEDANPYMKIYNLLFDFENFENKNSAKLEGYCRDVVVMVEYLKKGNFFKHLISSKCCTKDYNELVLFIGGLLLKNYAQTIGNGVLVNCAVPVGRVSEQVIEFDMAYNSNFSRVAFCPTVSGLKYSCESNTSIYFYGKTCVVIARTDVKAGCKISRLAYNIHLGVPFKKRITLLQELNINCACNFCTDERSNFDVFERFLCSVCKDYTIYPSLQGIEKACSCKLTEQSIATVNTFQITDIIFEKAICSLDLSTIKECIETFKRIKHPYSSHIIRAHQELIRLYAMDDNFDEFKAAQKKYKYLIEGIKKFDGLNYLNNMREICSTIYLFLQLYKKIMQKKDIGELLNYLENIINEAKAVAAIECPPMSVIFTPIETFLQKLRIQHISLEDIR